MTPGTGTRHKDRQIACELCLSFLVIPTANTPLLSMLLSPTSMVSAHCAVAIKRSFSFFVLHCSASQRRTAGLGWVLPEGLLQERPLQFHKNVRVKSGQPMSNSWSTSLQPDFVCALGSRTTVRNCQGEVLYKELLQSWSTLGQFRANSPSNCRSLTPCSSPLATPD